MAAWHRSWKIDIGLRFMGLASCGLAYGAIAHLVSLHPAAPPQPAGALAYLLAATGFVCASAGSAMTILGHHIFDEIEVSSRWRYKHVDRVSMSCR